VFASPAAFRSVRHTNGLFEALVGESFTPESSGAELPPLLTKGVVAGITQIARARLLAGEEGRLPEEADDMMRWAESLCDEVAAEVCRGSVLVAAERSAPQVGRAARARIEEPGDERTMILSVAARLAAEEGYAALTVPRIRAAAGVSRRRFHAHFDDVAECFTSALEMLVRRVVAEASEAYLSAGSWPHGIHRAVAATCRGLAADAALIRLLFFELYESRREAMRWRADLLADLSTSVRAGAAVGERPSAMVAEASVEAVWEVLQHYATTGRAAEMPTIADTASYLILAPAIGAEAAAGVIPAEREQALER
jgi:AcrR family transcriptional regulator